MAHFKWHLLTGKGSKQACGRGIGNSHVAVKWSEFKALPEGHQCETCAKSRVAELNKKSDFKKEQADLEAWEPEAPNAWMERDDATVAAHRAA